MGWLNLTMANQTVKSGLKVKTITLPQFFILQNFKKFSELIQSYEVPFSGSEWLICPEKFFFEYKPLLLLSFAYWPFSLCKILPVNPELCRCTIFWALNGPFPQMRIFSEKLLMILVSFIHAYLHAKNQSQILIYK